MRNGQNKRMRGRNRKGGHHQNPLSRMYESNGPDVKIRGTASHVAEKYLQLARDAQSSGDTKKAHAALRRMETLVLRHEDEFTSVLSADEIQFLFGLLIRLYEGNRAGPQIPLAKAGPDDRIGK